MSSNCWFGWLRNRSADTRDARDFTCGSQRFRVTFIARHTEAGGSETARSNDFALHLRICYRVGWHKPLSAAHEEGGVFVRHTDKARASIVWLMKSRVLSKQIDRLDLGRESRLRKEEKFEELVHFVWFNFSVS